MGVGQGALLFGQRRFGPYLIGDVGENHHPAAIRAGAVAHQIGLAAAGADGHRPDRIAMAFQAPLQPLFRRLVQHQPPAMHHRGDNFGEGLAQQFVQAFDPAKLGIKIIGQDQAVLRIVKGEGFRRERHRFLQPRHLGAGGGDVGP